jgi:hypothetical protein
LFTKNGPAEFAAPGTRTTKGYFMATQKSSAPAHPSTEETPHACLEGVVYIGHLVEDLETGEEVEVIEAVPCRRCADSR